MFLSMHSGLSFENLPLISWGKKKALYNWQPCEKPWVTKTKGLIASC